MKAERITCPDCGLVMEIRPTIGGSTLIYDVDDWHGRCKRVDQGSPAWCLVDRDGTNPKEN
jgi:hypothetical protein